MATRSRAYPGNAAGSFFVDDTCIDCDTCRQVAPLSFVDAGGHSEVRLQPTDVESLRAAARAVVCCPTASIGSEDKVAVRAAIAEFPLRIDGEVHYCGFNAESSYGGNSYFLARPDGNWMVDSPRFVPQLAEAIAARGGLAGIFLTHRDDVADAARWAERFGARRVIHRRDAAAAPGAELLLDGREPTELAPGLIALPTPGHTAGHAVLIADQRHCFTGDHLWGARGAEPHETRVEQPGRADNGTFGSGSDGLRSSRRQERLLASRSVCWHSWREQTESMARLAEQRFAWVLPGHGQRAHLEPEAMREALRALAERMRDEAADDDW